MHCPCLTGQIIQLDGLGDSSSEDEKDEDDDDDDDNDEANDEAAAEEEVRFHLCHSSLSSNFLSFSTMQISVMLSSCTA